VALLIKKRIVSVFRKKGIDLQQRFIIMSSDFFLDHGSDVTISDNGIGFQPEDEEKIFEMFYRVREKKYRGSGIGLPICKKIMDIHGGFVTAKCDPECTTFSCYFPI